MVLSRLPLSLLLITSLVTHFVTGSITCSVLICDFDTSITGDEMNLAACHMLVLSSPSSQLI